ncbi:MAG: NAD-dependent epimerase/dehydratase family protein [Chitinophagaceae bacterium]|nr:NAD-dependent epimerase/dehydratase family protein [Chitinophagaceae bacterium]
MRVLLTGASGFLGSYFYSFLCKMNAEVVRVGRDKTNEVQADLAVTVPALHGRFDWVIHAAGKAHSVPKTDAEAAIFDQVNRLGTEHLCQALQHHLAPHARFLFISTVAVYGCDEGEAIAEDAPLQGYSAYAVSKIDAEKFLHDWCQQAMVRLCIFRLPLVVGRQAPGNLGDMLAAVKAGKYRNVGTGDARKSMVLATDVAAAIPAAMEAGGVFNLTDGHHPSFAALSGAIAQALQRPLPGTIPLWLAAVLAKLGDLAGPRFPINTMRLQKLTAHLTFDDSKARAAFGWLPRPVLSEAAEWVL